MELKVPYGDVFCEDFTTIYHIISYIFAWVSKGAGCITLTITPTNTNNLFQLGILICVSAKI